MGVSSIVRSNLVEIATTVDLVEIAKSYDTPVKILVDFHCWEGYIRDCFIKSYELRTGNKFVALYGGEYSLLDAYTKQVISNLRKVNIELVFYLSAAKGCTQKKTDKDEIHRAWKIKFEIVQRSQSRCLAFLNGKMPLEHLRRQDIDRPALQEVQNFITLCEAGCEYHMCLEETVLAMARRLKSDSSAFAVFSSNSDFCLFENCTLIHNTLFDGENDLHLDAKELPTSGPEKLMCGLVSSDAVCRFLKFENHSELVEFSIISGNRFTSPRILASNGFNSGSSTATENICSMVRQWKVVEECKPFKRGITSPGMQEAIRKTRRFYKLHMDESHHVTEPGDTYHLLKEGVEKGRLPSTLIAMYHGTYSQRMVIEDPGFCSTPADGALLGLRAYLYSLVLPPNRQTVKEVGRGPSQNLEVTEVSKVTGIPIPSLARVHANSFTENRRLFELIIQHQDDKFLDEKSSYFTVYGNRLGFLCYLLRYFLLMNWEQHLRISPEEFFVCVAWLLGQNTPGMINKCMRLGIVPSPRCLTVQSWFSCLYRTVYSFLGNLLDLNSEFPTPKDLFSGSVWVVLYTAVAVNDFHPDHREPMPCDVSSETIQEVSSLVRNIVKDNRLVVKNIVRDLFPFGPK